jgi:Cd2+/Zn2+-exporting ATPase
MFRKNALPIPTLALILAIVLLACSKLIPMGETLKLILCVLSFLAAGYPLALPILRDLTRNKRPGYPLLLVLACILCLCANKPAAGAAAMILYRITLPVLEWRRSAAVRIITRRKEQADLGERIGEFQPDPDPGDDLGRFLKLWLPYIVPALAALYVILAALLTKTSIPAILRRAAMFLALGNVVPLFWSFGLCDFSASVNACEQGAIFTGDSLSRLCGTKLCCFQLPDTLVRGDAVIQSAMPKEVPPAALLELAACAWSCSPSHLGDTLAELLGHRTDPELLERYQELRDFGVLARIRGRVIICGSAEFMQRASLPLVPFKDRENTIHVGIDGKYAGCIRLNQTEPEEGELEDKIRACGLYRFGDMTEAGEKRFPEETLLYASGDGDRGPAWESDLYAALGGCGKDPEIVTAPGGSRGALLLLGALLNDKNSRKLCFLPALGLKILLLVLAFAGYCPVWFTVLVELAVTLLGGLLARRALKAKL